MRKYLLLLVFYALTAAAATTYAQVGRLLPANGERGITGATQALPVIRIGNRVMRLAPGGLIYDQQNRFLVHDQLPPGADVLYIRNQAGDLERIYILTPLERAMFDRAGKR